MPPLPFETQILLPRDPRASTVARDFVEEFLRPTMSDNAVGNLKLVVSELVTNAFQHGDGEISLSVRHTGDVVRVEVVDSGDGPLPTPEDARLGLRAVEALAERWGAVEGSTRVWAEVAV